MTVLAELTELEVRLPSYLTIFSAYEPLTSRFQ